MRRVGFRSDRVRAQVSCEFAKLDQFLTKLRSDEVSSDLDEEWRSVQSFDASESVPCSYQPSLENVSELESLPEPAHKPTVRQCAAALPSLPAISVGL